LLIDHQSGLFQLVRDIDQPKVFCIIDASGNWSKMATDVTIARIAQAGAMPIDTCAVLLNS
jgi:hypothetical protein